MVYDITSKPSREKALANESQKLQWMRQVSMEEARNCLKNLEYLFLHRKTDKQRRFLPK
ncbi:hypothetical protein [Helicobacter aurati]|uniref:hypothetical protein n=1 Tax=Helicobacter aurati TaxID=137778 RepID=UPI001315978C|nr:hypothetical protein [Helicobacter aurati]